MIAFHKIVNYSNGKWVRLEEAGKALGLVPNKVNGTLFSNKSLNTVVELIKNREGETIWYRAYEVKQRTFVDLAKFRKSLGINAAIESHKLGAVA